MHITSMVEGIGQRLEESSRRKLQVLPVRSSRQGGDAAQAIYGRAGRLLLRRVNSGPNNLRPAEGAVTSKKIRHNLLFAL